MQGLGTSWGPALVTRSLRGVDQSSRPRPGPPRARTCTKVDAPPAPSEAEPNAEDRHRPGRARPAPDLVVCRRITRWRHLCVGKRSESSRSPASDFGPNARAPAPYHGHAGHGAGPALVSCRLYPYRALQTSPIWTCTASSPGHTQPKLGPLCRKVRAQVGRRHAMAASGPRLARSCPM